MSSVTLHGFIVLKASFYLIFALQLNLMFVSHADLSSDGELFGASRLLVVLLVGLLFR